jgi:dephospho-CoA kinase
MPYKVGLTGGIGSGKSTVAQAFAALGVPTLSADAIAHELSGKNQPGYLKIVEVFGTDILKPDGELDRKALGDMIFSNRAQKAKLESILHPMIMQALHQQADALDAPYCILDIPLLINTAERERVNRILVVHCEQKERVARIQKRNGWPVEKIDKVMRNQVSDQELLEAADDVLDNDGDIAALREQVADLHRKYLLLTQ